MLFVYSVNNHIELLIREIISYKFEDINYFLNLLNTCFSNINFTYDEKEDDTELNSTEKKKDSNVDLTKDVEVVLEKIEKNENKIKVISLLRKHFGFGVVEAKNLIDSTPAVIKKIPLKLYEEISKDFTDIAILSLSTNK